MAAPLPSNPVRVVPWASALDIALIALLAAALYLASRSAARRAPRWRIPARQCAAPAAIVLVTLLLAASEPGPLAGHALPGWIHRAAILAAGAAGLALLGREQARIRRWRARLRAHIASAHRRRLAQTAAEAAGRATQRFLLTFSHELRGPVAGLLASARRLAQTPLPPHQEIQSTTILREAEQLSARINEVLDLRRIEQDRITLDSLPFAPDEVVAEVVQLLGGAAQESRVGLRYQAAMPAGVLVVGDPRRFRHVIVALVENALAFASGGPVTIALNYVTSVAPPTLGIRIADTGPGLSPGQRAALLTDGGAPTGLSIAHRLVTAMGGELTIASPPAGGSEFGVLLPVIPLRVAPPPPAAPTPSLASRRTSPHRPRVLIVDNIAASRTMLQIYLEQRGFAAETAADGGEAVRLAAAGAYDAILIDVNLPGVDGCETARRLRQDERPGRRPLLLGLTAALGKTVRDRCLAAGMDEQFAKPLDLRRFCRTLTELLARRSDFGPTGGPESAAAVTRRGGLSPQTAQ